MEPTESSKSHLEWPSLLKNLPLDEILKAANTAGINSVAIVGGAVRDELLNQIKEQPLQTPKDLDLVVEGSATQLAEALKDELEPRRLSGLRIYPDYDTAEIKIDGYPFDFATARIEKYKSPGQNPQVTPGSIEKDLQRRDFTVNAMALELSNMRLIDPYGGQASLANRELRFLHSKSVEEDPTRIIRAARYSARLLFDLAPEAHKQIKSTLLHWPWKWKQGDSPNLAPPALATRLRLEMELLFHEELWAEALENLQSWGGLVLLESGLQADKGWGNRLKKASELGVDLLTAFLAGSRNPGVVAARLQLPQHQQQILIQSLEIQKFLCDLLERKEYLSWTPSIWSHEIESNNWHCDAIALSICNGGPIWRPFYKWLNCWRFIKSPISAKELIQKGWEAGPLLGKELKKLRSEELDKLIN
ncbi:CCA tRNA nucleotidyltransferase [Prochlorococcus sp. MIT 1307]|uniref:CCA tRNA nucleotidyltransferase n=1 Tax=Prochlorococcus sp. MIT 1307 TaxID=3096219 RepID=UPI002A758393|nr:CCA tRNA nucleotidyltransferase [Prochlorococcus sp. MIT 1307]